MHFSPTQLTMPIDAWIYKYQHLNDEERHTLGGGFPMYGGAAVGKGVQEKFDPESVRASAQRFGETSTFVGSVAEIRERDVRLYNDRIEAKDSVEKERVLETVDAVRQYAIDGVREIVGAFPVQCEKKITTRFRHCMVEIIGYIDLFVESPCKIIELKTVWDNSHRGMKQGWASKKLPARPSNAHVSQVSVYWKALTDKGKNPEVFVVYAGKSGYVIYSQKNCESLSEDSLMKNLQQMRIQAIVRESLLGLRGVSQMTRFVPPNFDHPYIWEMPPEKLAEAKALWGISDV